MNEPYENLSRTRVTMSADERERTDALSSVPTLDRIAELITRHEMEEPFVVEWLELTDAETDMFVRLRWDPPHFSPDLFFGKWAHVDKHPDAGELRIVRVLTGYDGVTRAIGRQGKFLYAYPYGESD